MSDEDRQKWEAELMRPLPGQIDTDENAAWEMEQLREFL
jgi:hypothetical protein